MESAHWTYLIWATGIGALSAVSLPLGLTMIASTMIPEAVHSGNPSAVGLGTLAGFLSAIAFKLLE